MTTSKTLLIVEPDADIRTQLAVELREKLSMIIIQAADGLQAYQKARNQTFDVIITEFTTSKLDGAELIAAIRETNNNTHSPVIIYTKDIELAKIKTRGTKHIEYISKPADYEMIIKKVEYFSKKNLEKKEFKIDVDFINPFIDSSIKTLNAMCGVETINAQKPYLYNDEDKLDIDISGNLTITSPYFRGSIAISFSQPVYKKLISQMLEEGQENITLDNQDGAAEIINIIFGQTKAILNTRGYSLQRAIPNVVRGHGHKIYQSSKIPVLLVPFTSDAGDFFIQICVKAI